MAQDNIEKPAIRLPFVDQELCVTIPNGRSAL